MGFFQISFLHNYFQFCLQGKSIKVKMTLPDCAKSPDSQVSQMDININIILTPHDCYSLRCVQSVGACPRLNVKTPVQTTLNELKVGFGPGK